MNLRDRVEQSPMWRRPKSEWVKVRVRQNCSGFQYRGRDGEMHVVLGGDVAVIDSETAEDRRRNVEVLRES